MDFGIGKKKGACFGFFGMVLWFAVFWAFVEFYASVCVCVVQPERFLYIFCL